MAGEQFPFFGNGRECFEKGEIGRFLKVSGYPSGEGFHEEGILNFDDRLGFSCNFQQFRTLVGRQVGEVGEVEVAAVFYGTLQQVVIQQ